jgi:hypothetical protein
MKKRVRKPELYWDRRLQPEEPVHKITWIVIFAAAVFLIGLAYAVHIELGPVVEPTQEVP